MTDATAVRAGTRAKLRLMATTDLHMNLTGFDYCANRPDPSAGLTRIATLVSAARQEARDMGAVSLLVDNGDALQGEPLATLKADDSRGGHPLMTAMRYLRYDAIGLGNHDFNHGLDLLDTVLSAAPCPVVCTNLIRLDTLRTTRFARYAILDRAFTVKGQSLPVRIGIISCLPPQTVQWDAHFLQGRVIAQDILTAAKTWVSALRHRGCDLVVALAHTGLDDATAQPNMENAAIPLAEVEGIDAIIAGHSHKIFPGKDHPGTNGVDAENGRIRGVPAVMPGSHGSHLGIIDLDLTIGPGGRWRIADAACHLRPVSRRGRDGRAVPQAQEDTGLNELIAPYHRAAVAEMNEKVGTTNEDLHSYFTTIAPDRALAVLAAAQAGALRPALAGTAALELPLLSAVSAGKTGGRSDPGYYTDIPAGPVLRRHIADLHIFPNQLRAVILNGADLADWLEMSASSFNRIAPGSACSELLDPSVPGYMFDVIFGLSYAIDVTAPARYFPNGTVRSPNDRRVRDIRFANAPVDPAQRFVVVTNSYRASGGGGVPALKSAKALPVPAIEIRDALTEYLAGTLPADPLENAPGPWRFERSPGTRVSVRTGPGAHKYLDDLAGRNVQTHGLDGDGFLKISFDL